MNSTFCRCQVPTHMHVHYVLRHVAAIGTGATRLQPTHLGESVFPVSSHVLEELGGMLEKLVGVIFFITRMYNIIITVIRSSSHACVLKMIQFVK
jgi:hypothetical protein